MEISPMPANDRRLIARVVWGHVDWPGSREASDRSGESWPVATFEGGLLELRAGGALVARGEVCLHDGQLALRIVEVCGGLS